MPLHSEPRRVMYAAAACIVAGALAYVVLRRRPHSYGSTTNTYDAIDSPQIAPGASADEVLDVAVEYTFPASDPISIEHAYLQRK